jgi:predicted enzyme related to lactoylglutathione lyase
MFFRAEDPEVLREWYADTLGVVDPPKGIWRQEEGLTVFAPFSKDTDYFGRRDQTFMLNFRVRDLAAMLSQLRAAGVEVVREEQEESAGWFAWIVDLRATAWSFGSPNPACSSSAPLHPVRPLLDSRRSSQYSSSGYLGE